MTSDTTGIEREIASTRTDLGQSLEALGDRVAPKKVVARAKETAKAKVAEKVEDVKDRVSPPRVLRRKVAAVRSRLPEALGGDGDSTTQKTLPLANAARAQARQLPRGRSQAEEPGTGRHGAEGAGARWPTRRRRRCAPLLAPYAVEPRTTPYRRQRSPWLEPPSRQRFFARAKGRARGPRRRAARPSAR